MCDPQRGRGGQRRENAKVTEGTRATDGLPGGMVPPLHDGLGKKRSLPSELHRSHASASVAPPSRIYFYRDVVIFLPRNSRKTTTVSNPFPLYIPSSSSSRPPPYDPLL